MSSSKVGTTAVAGRRLSLDREVKCSNDACVLMKPRTYVSLLPGEKRELRPQLRTGTNSTGELVLTVDGWNLTRAGLPLVEE